MFLPLTLKHFSPVYQVLHDLNGTMIKHFPSPFMFNKECFRSNQNFLRWVQPLEM